jgi:hypothetical protein
MGRLHLLKRQRLTLNWLPWKLRTLLCRAQRQSETPVRHPQTVPFRATRDQSGCQWEVEAKQDEQFFFGYAPSGTVPCARTHRLCGRFQRYAPY